MTKRRWVALLGLLALALAALWLNGCTETNTRSESASESTKIEEMHPTPDGGFVKKTTEYTNGQKSSQTTTKSDMDWAGAVSKGIGQAASGDWVGLAATGVSALLAGGVAVVKHREAAANRKDSDEAWDRLMAEKDKAANG